MDTKNIRLKNDYKMFLEKIDTLKFIISLLTPHAIRVLKAGRLRKVLPK